MSENDPNSWGILGSVAGPVALLLAIYNAYSKTKEPDAQRHKQTEDAVNALGARIGLTERDVSYMKRDLDRVTALQEQQTGLQREQTGYLQRIMSYFEGTKPRRPSDPPGPRRVE